RQSALHQSGAAPRWQDPGGLPRAISRSSQESEPESGVPPVKAALRLSGRELAAGKSHGLEDLFVFKAGLLVGTLAFGGWTSRVRLTMRLFLADFAHRRPI